MTWSTESHAGDVNTLTELLPGLLCSAGSDCRVSRVWHGAPAACYHFTFNGSQRGHENDIR